MFEALPDALVVVDGHGRVVQANANAAELFGFPAAAMIGLEVEMLLPGTLGARHREHRARYMADPHVRPMGATGQSLVGQRGDGSVFPVEIALSPVETPDGRRYLASIRDVSGTARVRQSQVRARYDALAARIGQLALQSQSGSALLDALPRLLVEALGVDAVAILFPAGQGERTYVRAHALRDGGEVPPPNGQPLADTAVVIGDCGAGGESPGALPLAMPTSGSLALMPLRGRQGVSGALLALDTAPHRFDHDALHLLQLAADLLAAFLHQRHAEEQLAHAQRLDAIGQLTGGIAHDFNNLLTVMSGCLQLLESEPDAEQGRELIATALRSVGRGAELTGKLLAFARRQRLLPQAVDVGALLGDVVLMLGRTLGEKVRLHCRCQPSLPAAYADPARLETALVNLALNARDAMARGGAINVSAEMALVDASLAGPTLPVGYYVRIEVEDDGHGMAPETLARAMEPFFTTKGRDRGNGLGLSMVYGFARQSGGDLRIESALGLGTRVRLYLPVARDAAPPLSSGGTDTRHGRGERVLVVEDDEAVRAIAVAFLRAEGYLVEAVADGAGALRRLREEPGVALLLSDVTLGTGIDGPMLARTAQAEHPGLAVLLVSGNEERAGRLGAGFELLRKPFRREQLAVAVRRRLDAAGAGVARRATD
ncbi:ATP-binding protein [Luteimonas salinisoli]|uniref:ATP-binding protein n=1 Tax=Luteimonas salinisoli TaxID=2752307 RepID=UPI00214D848C|nr:ATP-binding protein [Luteimonas salinisoli]